MWTLLNRQKLWALILPALLAVLPLGAAGVMSRDLIALAAFGERANVAVLGVDSRRRLGRSGTWNTDYTARIRVTQGVAVHTDTVPITRALFDGFEPGLVLPGRAAAGQLESAQFAGRAASLRANALIALGLGLFFLAVTLGFFWLLWRRAARAIAARTGPEAEGTVDKIDLNHGNSIVRFSHPNGRATTFPGPEGRFAGLQEGGPIPLRLGPKGSAFWVEDLR